MSGRRWTEITDITEAQVAYIARHMRDSDRREIFAVRWNDDEDELVRDVTMVAGKLWRVWLWDGEPVAINGVVPIRPGVVNCASFGTDKWRNVIRPMTHWSREWLIPCLQVSHYHRGEAYVAASNIQSRRWLRALGANVEAYLHHFGRNKEDFILYAWRLDDVLSFGRGWQRRPVSTDVGP